MVIHHPKVTVAMITYNHEKYIASSIDSILEQTFEDFELVIVDDGSSDATAELIRGFTDRRIRFIRQDNQGPSEARNAAIRAARGQLLAQMSGDDIAEPSRLAHQIMCHHERPHSVIFSRCTFIDDSGSKINYPRRDSNFNHVSWSREETLRHLFFIGNCFLAPSAFAASDHFRDVGPYKPQLLQMQDYDMWVRFLIRGYDAYIVQQPLLRYRVRSDGGNLDSPSMQGINNRCFFEKRFILEEFTGIRNANDLATVFPEVRSLGYPIDDDLVSFLLAMMSLLPEHRNPQLANFGAETLVNLMSNSKQRQILKEKAGFLMSDFFRILGEVNYFPERDHLEAKIKTLKAEISRLHSSTSWRLTSPLRQLMSRLQGLRQLL
jgi:glycosyltransferase involved in cell wall biosynthesis